MWLFQVEDWRPNINQFSVCKELPATSVDLVLAEVRAQILLNVFEKNQVDADGEKLFI